LLFRQRRFSPRCYTLLPALPFLRAVCRVFAPPPPCRRAFIDALSLSFPICAVFQRRFAAVAPPLPPPIAALMPTPLPLFCYCAMLRRCCHASAAAADAVRYFDAAAILLHTLLRCHVSPRFAFMPPSAFAIAALPLRLPLFARLR